MLYENHISETILNAFVLPPPPPPPKKMIFSQERLLQVQYSCIPNLDKIFFGAIIGNTSFLISIVLVYVTVPEKRVLVAQIMIFLYRRFSATTPKNNSRDKTFVFVSYVSPTLCLHSR